MFKENRFVYQQPTDIGNDIAQNVPVTPTPKKEEKVAAAPAAPTPPVAPVAKSLAEEKYGEIAREAVRTGMPPWELETNRPCFVGHTDKKLRVRNGLISGP